MDLVIILATLVTFWLYSYNIVARERVNRTEVQWRDVPHVSIADIRMRRSLNHEPPAIRDIGRKVPRSVCYTTGMFTLSNPYACVTSAAFAQA